MKSPAITSVFLAIAVMTGGCTVSAKFGLGGPDPLTVERDHDAKLARR